MADDVTISIGATLDGLATAVNGARSSLETLQTGVQALAGAFAIREIAEFASGMAELGLQAERTAAILGITTTSAQELAGISLLSGGSADQLTSSLSRLQLGLERGQRATSAQAAAFRAMGVNMQQMLAASPDQQVDILANAVERLHNQGINAAPALSLINRGLASLMPMLQGGATEIDHFRQRLIDVGAIVSSETTEKLAVLHQELTLLGQAFQGLGETIVSSGVFARFASEVSQAVGNLTALIATGNLVNYIFEWMAGEADLLGAKLAKLAVAFANLFSGHVTDAFTNGMERVDAAIDEANKELAETNARFEEIKKTFQSGLGGGAGLKPLQVNLDASRDATKLAELAYKEQVQLIDNLYNSFAITEAQKTSMLIAEVNKRMKAEIAAGESVKVAEEKAAADIAKIHADETKKIMNDWKSMADSLASNISGALDSVLNGTRTWSQAMIQMFAKMIEEMIAWVIKLIAEWIVLDIVSGGTATLAGTASQMGGFGGALANAFTSHQAGTGYVPTTGLAMIHEGEAIIPAYANPANAGATPAGNVSNTTFGGHNVNLAISAVDATSFMSLLRRNPGAFSSFTDLLRQRHGFNELAR